MKLLTTLILLAFTACAADPVVTPPHGETENPGVKVLKRDKKVKR